MNAEQAKAILKERFILDDGDIGCHWRYVSYDPGNSQTELEGGFTADELEAIAWWMRNAGEGKP